MRQAVFILIFGLLFSSCKKSSPTPISVNDGTYVGDVSILPSTGYSSQASFVVKGLSSTKIKIFFPNGGVVVEADLNGSNFTIIPAYYRGNDGQTEYKYVTTGEGSFGDNSLTIRWHSECLTVKNSYSEYRGTLTKF